MNEQPLKPIGQLLSAAWQFYARHARLIMLVTLPVVAFVDVVIGAGLGELTAGVHKKLPAADFYISLAGSELVAVPLLTAMVARTVVIAGAGGERPRARRVLEEGLDLFLPALVAMILFWIGVIGGLFFFVIPGIYLAVSWYLVVQAAVIDGHRGVGAINASAALVRGRWWHTAGVLLVLQLAAGIPSAIIAIAFEGLAKVANSDALVIAGNVLVDTVALPFVAVGATLYYLELRALSGAAQPR